MIRLLVVCMVSLLFTSNGFAWLIGGQASPLSEYPAVVYISMGDSVCTASIVSPSTAKRAVILTAGHCVENGQVITPVLKNKIRFRAVCDQAPPFTVSKTHTDMALCLAEGPINVKGITIASQGPLLNEKVLIAGYGCTGADHGRGPTGGNDGILRIGTAPVTQVSGKDTWFYTRAKTASCPGDSGGPSFRIGSVLKQLGVTSRGNFMNLSLLTDLNAPGARMFLTSWVTTHKAEICGVNVACP